MTKHFDTITAISTPIGKGGISVIRISGGDSRSIIKKIFKGNTRCKSLKSHSIYHGKIYDKKKIIDEVLLSVFIKPNSYTGEDVIEISCHGGTFVTQSILQLVLKSGARLAKPGEFTKRAFLNGKIDLTKAESVIDLIESKTKHAQEAAINRIEGKLYYEIKKILDKISKIRTEIELDIDFSDQDLNRRTYSEMINYIEEIYYKIEKLVKSGDEGIILNEGYRIVIAGEPNAGKSSLFNKIMENERAIVTEVPGTTRDYIEEDISLDGYLVKLFDTAGIRNCSNIVEKAGIKKSVDMIEKAHLVLWVKDIRSDQEDKIPPSLDKKDTLLIYNKIDLSERKKFKKDPNRLYISALKGTGVSYLKQEIIKRIDVGDNNISNGIISNARQLAAAKKSMISIEKAIATAKEKKGLEFIAFELQEASESLEEIIGKITSDEIINSIFSRFCVGK